MRRRCPIALFLIAFIVAIPITAFGQSAMGPPAGVIVAPAQAPRSIAFQAEQLRRLLIVRLVNRGMFRIVSSLAFEATLQSQGLTVADLSVPEHRGTVASLLSADYILDTSLSANGDSGAWSLILTNLTDGTAVWSTAIPVSPQRPNEAVRTAAEQLDLFGRDVRMVQLQDIEALIDAGDLPRAATLYQRYLETHAPTQESRRLGDLIDEHQAHEHYARAQRFAELWLFDEAFIEINRAIALRPEEERYTAYIEEIRQERESAKTAQVNERLEIVRTLLKDGYYTSADTMLQSIVHDDEAASQRPEVVVLEAAITDAIGARANYRSAMSAYWSGDYTKARAELSEAIRRAPDRPEYARLLEQIDDASAHRDTTDIVWQEYRNQFASLDLQRMVSGPVQVDSSWEGGIGAGVFSYRDIETLKETEVDQLIATGGYRRPYLLPIGLETSFFSLYGGWHAGGSIRVGSNEVDDATVAGDGTRRLSRRTVWSLGPVGGGFLQARLFGFSLAGGIELNNHFLIVSRLDRDPARDTDSYTTNAAWVPEFNWFTGLSWHWNDENRVTLRYTDGLASWVVPQFDKDTERYRSNGITLSYGRSVW